MGWLNNAKQWARSIKRDVVALWLAARDPRTPLPAKVMAAAVAAYALSPIDLIPDFIPVLGWRTEPRDGVKHLIVDWREEGGPPVSAPRRQSFGTKLVTYNCKAEGGSASFEFNPAGLRVELRLPVS